MADIINCREPDCDFDIAARLAQLAFEEGCPECGE